MAIHPMPPPRGCSHHVFSVRSVPLTAAIGLIERSMMPVSRSTVGANKDSPLPQSRAIREIAINILIGTFYVVEYVSLVNAENILFIIYSSSFGTSVQTPKGDIKLQAIFCDHPPPFTSGYRPDSCGALHSMRGSVFCCRGYWADPAGWLVYLKRYCHYCRGHEVYR